MTRQIYCDLSLFVNFFFSENVEKIKKGWKTVRPIMLTRLFFDLAVNFRRQCRLLLLFVFYFFSVILRVAGLRKKLSMQSSEVISESTMYWRSSQTVVMLIHTAPFISSTEFYITIFSWSTRIGGIPYPRSDFCWRKQLQRYDAMQNKLTEYLLDFFVLVVLESNEYARKETLTKWFSVLRIS